MSGTTAQYPHQGQPEVAEKLPEAAIQHAHTHPVSANN